MKRLFNLFKTKRRVNYITFDLKQARFLQAVKEDDIETMRKLLKR